MLHHVVLPAFTPKRCKRVGKPFDKITEQWQQHHRHHRRHRLRKQDQRPLVANRTKARDMGISHMTKVMVTRDMVTRDMAIKGTTKGTATNKQDIFEASNSIVGTEKTALVEESLE